MITIIEVRPAYPGAARDGCFSIFGTNDDDDYLGDIEQLADGKWIGDTSCGVAAPSQPFATRAEAIEYVVTPSATRTAEVQA